MTTIVLANHLGRLRNALEKIPGPVRFINLANGPQTADIISYLHQRADTWELPTARLFRERREEFSKKYVELIAELNERNHSLEWWAMPFTNKNPLATRLCRNASYFLLISDLSRSDTTPLIVLIDDFDLMAQVKEWSKKESIQTINVTAAKRLLTWNIVVKAFSPAAVVYAFFKTFWIWLQVSRYKVAIDASNKEGYTVVSSLLHTSSLAEPGIYRDVYFGRLVDDLARDGEKTIVFGALQENWGMQLSRLRATSYQVPVIPMESYLSLGALIVCGLKALRSYFTPAYLSGPSEINQIDISCLVKRSIREARRSGNLFVNLKVYYCARGLAQEVPLSRCLYPYENRSWEKMLLLGIRSVTSGARMVGYQHATVTPAHTNFLLGPEEAKVLPLPDAIATTGPAITEWLEAEGRYPAGIFRTTFALRQSNDAGAMLKPRPAIIEHLLVVLATSVEEYLGTYAFLHQAFSEPGPYQVRIRPHPTISWASALKTVPTGEQTFYSLSPGLLTKDLEWADVVLYASSTVGMEAISQGIPAIHLDLGEFLNTDPMFGWNGFKWSIDGPTDLFKTIKDIESLSDETYLQLQEGGRDYTRCYLTPPPAEGIRGFFEDLDPLADDSTGREIGQFSERK